jgi:hypothetical protein
VAGLARFAAQQHPGRRLHRREITGTTLSVGDRAERAPGSMVSANYFDAIGVPPLLGRGFAPGEDIGRNAHPVTVISYQAWHDRFHGDPAILVRTQMLNGLLHTIVGVAPRGFFGTFVGYAFHFWAPASMQPQCSGGVYKLEDRSARSIEGFVRLKRGVTIEQAQAELSAIMTRLEREYPDTNRGRSIRLFPLWQTPLQRLRTGTRTAEPIPAFVRVPDEESGPAHVGFDDDRVRDRAGALRRGCRRRRRQSIWCDDLGLELPHQQIDRLRSE